MSLFFFLFFSSVSFKIYRLTNYLSLLISGLKFAVLDSYYGCLKERQRRKRFVKF